MRLFFILFVSFFLTTFAPQLNGQGDPSLLTQEDFDWLSEKNTNGPHLSSSIDAIESWESYDQWTCFKTENIKIDCATYDRDIVVPNLTAKLNGHTFLFDLHIDGSFDCELAASEWALLISKSEHICMMAAKMPGVFPQQPNKMSLWYLYAFKTNQGYWLSN